VTNPAPDSGAYHTDERWISCSKLNRGGGETRILPSPHSHDNIFLSQPLINLAVFSSQGQADADKIFHLLRFLMVGLYELEGFILSECKRCNCSDVVESDRLPVMGA
jgi:hypothetical protein